MTRRRLTAREMRAKVLVEIDWYRNESFKMGNEDAFAELTNLRQTVAKLRLTTDTPLTVTSHP